MKKIFCLGLFSLLSFVYALSWKEDAVNKIKTFYNYGNFIYYKGEYLIPKKLVLSSWFGNTRILIYATYDNKTFDIYESDTVLLDEQNNLVIK